MHKSLFYKFLCQRWLTPYLRPRKEAQASAKQQSAPKGSFDELSAAGLHRFASYPSVSRVPFERNGLPAMISEPRNEGHQYFSTCLTGSPFMVPCPWFGSVKKMSKENGTGPILCNCSKFASFNMGIVPSPSSVLNIGPVPFSVFVFCLHSPNFVAPASV